MGLMRQALLWASRNERLRQRVPHLGFVRRAVRQFMPGETLDAALAAARTLADRGLPVILTHLGENVGDPGEADAAAEHYLEVLDRVAELGLDAEISVKLTHLGYDLDREASVRRVERLARDAGERGTHVWIDMESSPYVEGTLQAYRRLRAAFPNVGVCLQAYLRRTAADLEALVPLEPSVRLVKGAYREPREVAFPSREEVDRSFFHLAVRALRLAEDGRLRLALGTHDVDLVRRVDRASAAMEVGRRSYEVQMLYGIRPADQLRLAGAGYRVRVLIAYGPHWYPWYMRRLAERPANLLFVLRNLVGPGGAPGPPSAG